MMQEAKDILVAQSAFRFSVAELFQCRYVEALVLIHGWWSGLLRVSGSQSHLAGVTRDCKNEMARQVHVDLNTGRTS
jgi:hypothetical protein